MLFFATLLIASTIPPASQARAPVSLAINGVWGDASWEHRFGRAPNMKDAPEDRVRVHLEEVLDRLRDVPTSHLPPTLRTRRAEALDVLSDYIVAGAYPQNVDDPFSRPEFIDHAGRLCAVGAMVAGTEDREVAEQLDRLYNRDSIWAMDDQIVADWAESHGLSPTELALIQPSYTPEWFHPRTHTNQAFGVRVGAAVYGESEYRNSFEGLTGLDDLTPEVGAWWLWQPGTHWGLGAAVNLRANVENYYEGQTPGLSLLLKAEYCEPIARRGLLDFLVIFEGGPLVVVSSPGNFAGFELGGGLGFASTLGILNNLAFRLEVRAQHYRLWGSDSQKAEGSQILATFGAEWRFSL